jgi:hypothetical protein
MRFNVAELGESADAKCAALLLDILSSDYFAPGQKPRR